ncbi:energy transducer TonB [Porphyromonas gulae]|uniref:M56 family metallopeptidase n=1 Tax=Porphyromonas gulae TaxID=111105 RepID=UPI00052D333A|nr:M56 family metallopeptidase [Porphyromonas gulae]KGN75411.1 energy transducer TonB [Porphyromonas gulae]KGN77112.1 energy transducer TonB [Porphyromonas gulae]KGO03915.1 energy transducer TonB [Porphyromonas gulae]KKC50360.1 energy transducer TonB [Porphyromonas gulae]
MSYTLVLYMVVASLGLALFWIFERLMIHGNTHCRLRRAYYLGGFVSVAILPFLGYFLPSWPGLFVQNRSVGMEILRSIEIVLPEALVRTAGADAIPAVSPLLRGLFLAWLLGIGVLLIRFGIRLGSLLCLIRGAERAEIEGVPVYFAPRVRTPFSFRGRIYLPTDLRSYPSVRNILIHEQEHTRATHFVDLLIAEVACMLFWFNPFAWALKRDMQRNLEFLADRAVLLSGASRREYQYELLGFTMEVAAGPLCSSYNINDLKERIRMMNKTKSNRAAGARYLVALPLAALMLLSGKWLWAGNAVSEVREVVAAVASDPTPLSDAPDISLQQDEDPVYSEVDTPPSFPGGMSKLMHFLSKNLKYPEQSAKNGIEGKVIVSFIVEKDGRLTNIRVEKSVAPELDAEAVRVISVMPKWNPGKQKGKTVRTSVTQPVRFRVQ